MSESAPLRRGLPRSSGGEPWPPAGSTPAPGGARPPVGVRRPPAQVRWARRALIGIPLTVMLAAAVVLVARAVVQVEPVAAFIATYPGTIEPTAGTPTGFPAWLGWQHFLNAFFLTLVVRTGIEMRSGKRPAAHWLSRRHGAQRISLTQFVHQSLDVLWLVNGAGYIVVLLASGRWPRIVPTSWDVVPHALSAGLQYLSLDWPTEDGWISYNALQQLSYFGIVFVVAPLAAITGFRLSTVWPTRAGWLSRVYPARWARALHFPMMLAFSAFIVVHVGLVLTTGALRNLNHMYAARDAVDGWGLLIFGLSLVATAAAWLLMRPSVIAPLARLFGTVSR